MEGRPLSVLKQRILNSLWSKTFGAYDAFGIQSIVHLLHTRVYCVIWLSNQVAVSIQEHTDQPGFPTKRGGGAWGGKDALAHYTHNDECWFY